LKIPTFLEAPDMSLEDLYVFMMKNEAEINWEALQMMLDQGNSSPIQTTQTIQSLKESIKYALGKILRFKRTHSKELSGCSLSEIIRMRLNDKKLYIPAGFH
jgi:hypothetical protein